jgi:hypothetical protein
MIIDSDTDLCLHLLYYQIFPLIKPNIRTDQPIKRGRGSSTLDRPLDEQVFGESRLYKKGPEHRRSTTKLAFGSRIASDRGMNLNCGFEH